MLLDRKGTEVEYKQVISTSVNTEIISPFPYIYKNLICTIKMHNSA